MHQPPNLPSASSLRPSPIILTYRPVSENRRASGCISRGLSDRSQCPHRSSDENVAPLILSASACATLGGLTVSASPVTSSVGAPNPPRIDRGRLGQRLAGAGIAFRILAHDRFAHEGDGGRRWFPLVCAESALATIWSAISAMPPERASRRALGKRLARSRPPARRARRTAPASATSDGCVGGDHLADDGAHRMADEMRPGRRRCRPWRGSPPRSCTSMVSGSTGRGERPEPGRSRRMTR